MSEIDKLVISEKEVWKKQAISFIIEKVVFQAYCSLAIKWKRRNREFERIKKTLSLDEINKQYPYLRNSNKYKRYLLKEIDNGWIALNKYTQAIISRIIKRSGNPLKELKRFLEEYKINISKAEKAIIKKTLLEYIAENSKISCQEKCITAGNYIINDTSLSDENIRSLFMKNDKHAFDYEYVVQSIESIVSPIIERLKNMDLTKKIFLLPGNWAQIMLNEIWRLDPELKQNIKNQSLIITSNRILVKSDWWTSLAGGKAEVTVSKQNIEELQNIKGKECVILDDVISSWATIKAITKNIPKNIPVQIFAWLWLKKTEEDHNIPLGAEVFCSVLLQRSDNTIPPVNTLSTLVHTKDPKNTLAWNTLTAKNWVFTNEWKKNFLDEYIMNSKILPSLEILSTYENLIFCDVDDTMTPTLDYDMWSTIEKIQQALEEKNMNGKNAIFILNSDSPAQELSAIQDKVFSENTLLIAEKWAILAFTDKDTQELVQYPIDKKNYIDMQNIEKELSDRLSSLAEQSDFEFIAADDASQQISDGNIKWESTSTSVVLLNTGRKASKWIYVRKVDENWKILGNDTAILKKIEKIIVEELTLNDKYLIKRYDDPEWSILIKNAEIYKGMGITKIKKLLYNNWYTMPSKTVMVGNSISDYIPPCEWDTTESDVENWAVANATNELKQQPGVKTTTKELSDWVIEVIKQI